MQELQAVWSGPLGGDAWWEMQADEPAYAASLVKLPLAIAAERVDLERRVPVHADFASAVGGRFVLDRDDDQDDATWGALGASETLEVLRRRAVVDSSNIAANLLLEAVGLAAVTDVLAAAGVSGRTAVTRGIGDVAARDAGLTNEVTARDVARVLAVVPPAVEALMLDQAHRGGIPAGLPDGVHVANKTGWVDGIDHDAVIVRPADGEAFALVVLTRGDRTHDDGLKLVAQVAAEAWERRR